MVRPDAERRKEPRFSITGRVDARIKKLTGDPFTFFPVDVSASGLGIILDVQAPEGDIVELLLNGQPNEPIALEVVWCMRLFDGMDVFRTGLKVHDTSMRLDEIFATMDDVQLEDLR